MTLNHCFDAAHPPDKAPAHCDAVLGYIGGRDATHVWSLDEWDRFRHLRQFPAWVADITMSPAAQARAAANTAHSLGWHDGRAIIVDMETTIAREWYAEFAHTLHVERYLAVCYGSLSTVLANAANLVWIAAWDGKADLLPGQTIEAEQYAHDIPDGDTSYDLSIVSDVLMRHGGIGPRI
jgi:hypothetical protein